MQNLLCHHDAHVIWWGFGHWRMLQVHTLFLLLSVEIHYTLAMLGSCRITVTVNWVMEIAVDCTASSVCKTTRQFLHNVVIFIFKNEIVLMAALQCCRKSANFCRAGPSFCLIIDQSFSLFLNVSVSLNLSPKHSPRACLAFT